MGFGALVLDIFTGGAGSAILGGITGLVGTFLKQKHDLKIMELQWEERKDERNHDLSMLKLEGETSVKVAEVQRQESQDVASSKTQAESYKMEPLRFAEGLEFPDTWYGRLSKTVVAILMFMLDFVRGAVRPALTIYLAIITSIIYFEIQAFIDAHNLQISGDEAMDADVVHGQHVLLSLNQCRTLVVRE